MIKIILHNVASKPDIYGNRYHYTFALSTITGDAIQFSDHPSCNVIYYARKALNLEFDEYYAIDESIPIKEWRRKAKQYPYLSEEEIIKGFKAICGEES